MVIDYVYRSIIFLKAELWYSIREDGPFYKSRAPYCQSLLQGSQRKVSGFRCQVFKEKRLVPLVGLVRFVQLVRLKACGLFH